MKYFEFTFSTHPCTETVNDVLAAVLGDAGFESFVECDKGLTAYIQQPLCDEAAIQTALNDFPLAETEITYTFVEAEDKDWNEEWEKNFFQPIIIEDRCVIHSTFHHDVPQAEYDIVINPQMAFGTGHHETTSLILAELLENELEGKSLLDMGCGTSILAILARLRGANPCTAIDIDEWCVRNSLENIELNGVTGITVEEGDAAALTGKGAFDIVIANINRNILLNDMKHYVACMHSGSELYMSGFYADDVAAIRAEAERNGLTFVHQKEKNRWAAVKFILSTHNKEEYPPMHSAEHILNATMVKTFGCARSRNAHIEKKKSKCDYCLPACPTQEQMQEIENKVNEVIGQHLMVTTEFMSKEEAGKIVDLSKLPEEANQTLRIVRIGDYDACACIGQHVENTSEIGTFKIISYDYDEEKRTLRMRFKLAN